MSSRKGEQFVEMSQQNWVNPKFPDSPVQCFFSLSYQKNKKNLNTKSPILPPLPFSLASSQTQFLAKDSPQTLF